ncbi:hypothetical protein CYMTET_28559 [Cymbomonas tetramitiformis]|uniref:DUF3456 domain-containing protein n=1 Tax=Cymbomonas tetramitiformis TaxID=36881 RepID=A0AAE0FP55_9CHLO|nr:hypothetical protein CYMTET_28559 [Cymbomonas tetramitiformis]
MPSHLGCSGSPILLRTLVIGILCASAPHVQAAEPSAELEAAVSKFISDPAQDGPLKCAACAAASAEIYSFLLPSNDGMPPGMKQNAVGESVCGIIADQYGLAVDDNVPLAEFTRDESREKYMDNKAFEKYLKTTCENVKTNSALMWIYHSLPEFERKVCLEDLGLCTDKSYPRVRDWEEL